MYAAVLRIRTRDPGKGVFLIPGTGVRDMFFTDPGSSTHISERLETILWIECTIFLCQFDKFFVCQYLFKNKIILEFVNTKKGKTTNFSLSSFVVVAGSEIHKNQDTDPG
jgi:hypothetical protein